MQAGIVLAIAALYGGYLNAPLLFDDFGLVDTDAPRHWDFTNVLGLRWYSYASLHWSMALFGEHLWVLHAGNLLLHMLACLVLFQFLLRMFSLLCPAARTAGHGTGLPPHWLAFAGTLLFALHPAATYGVIYLTQRTILSATLFGLLTWWLFLEGMLRERRAWLYGSALAYLLAVLGKEHAILVPAANLAILVLLKRFDKPTLLALRPLALLYAIIAAFTFFQARAGNIYGQAYEPYAGTILDLLGIVPGTEHPLSVITQAYLFFSYLGHWLLPIPTRMSVAMDADFARGFLTWPHSIGLPLFLLAYLFALRLLWRGGRAGLVGFAFAVPASLFAVEFFVVRVQEILVLYRSYLWMPALACALPLAGARLRRRWAAALLAGIAVYLAGASLSRLELFSDSLKLWDDALRLGKDTKRAWNLGRLYHNRGVAYLDQGRYDEALVDLNQAIRLAPMLNNAYHDRAVVHLEKRRYTESLSDFNRAIQMSPKTAFHYYGRAHTYLALGRTEEARQDFDKSCRLGRQAACSKLPGP